MFQYKSQNEQGNQQGKEQGTGRTSHPRKALADIGNQVPRTQKTDAKNPSKQHAQKSEATEPGKRQHGVGPVAVQAAVTEVYSEDREFTAVSDNDESMRGTCHKAMTESGEPTTESTKPTVENVEHTAESAAPTAESAEPMTESAEPMTESAEPMTESAEPMTESAEPMTESAEPMTESIKPIAESAEPMTESAEPIAESVKPIAESAEPMAESAEPTTENAEPRQERESDQHSIHSDGPQGSDQDDSIHLEDFSAIIPDIDEDDMQSPEYLGMYVRHIYTYMLELEQRFAVRENYLQGKAFQGSTRDKLVNWLVRIHHDLDLKQETIYLTVSILDRTLQATNQPKSKLALIGVASLYIATKYEGGNYQVPRVEELVRATGNTVVRKDLLAMECQVLQALRFNLGKPIAMHFLRRYWKAAEHGREPDDPLKYVAAKYLQELSLVRHDLAHIPPSKLAAAALSLARALFSYDCWSHTLAHYSKYHENDLLSTMFQLADILDHAPSGKLGSVYRKFSTRKFSRIAENDNLKQATSKLNMFFYNDSSSLEMVKSPLKTTESASSQD